MGNRLFPIKDKLRASTVSSAARLSIPFKSLVFGMDPRLCAPWLPRVYLFGNFFFLRDFQRTVYADFHLSSTSYFNITITKRDSVVCD